MRKVIPIAAVVLSLALLAGEVSIADGKKPKKATLTLTVTPNPVKSGKQYKAELKGYSGRFNKLAVDAHRSPCADTVKQENKTHTIYTHVVPSKTNYDWVTKFVAGPPGQRHVCAYLYDQNNRGDPNQRHKSVTYTSTAR